MNGHDRFLAHLSADALDEADRSHATGCPECRPLLPGVGAVAAAPALGPSHALAVEAIRTSPVRPWWRDATLVAGLNAVVAVAATLLLGGARWGASDAERGRLALVGVLLFGTLTLGGMAALAPRRRHSPFSCSWHSAPLGLVLTAG